MEAACSVLALVVVLLFLGWIAEPESFVEALRTIRGGKR